MLAFGFDDLNVSVNDKIRLHSGHSILLRERSNHYFNQIYQIYKIEIICEIILRKYSNNQNFFLKYILKYSNLSFSNNLRVCDYI